MLCIFLKRHKTNLMKNFTILFCILISVSAMAQLTITNGNHTLEISGGISGYYNARNLKSGEFDNSKDRFRLRDAQLQLEGRIGKIYEYDLQVDFADIAANSANTAPDPENPGLMEAKIKYKGLGFMDVEFGYGKLYYSRNTLVPFSQSVFWQRPDLVSGNLFSQRDVGVTIIKNFYDQRVNAYLGMYTGLGEISILGDNDPSGKLEYVGRVDFSYPAKFRYRDIDDKISPVPMFSIGINGRYANKSLPDGSVFPAFSQGAYGMKVVNGKKYVYGFDAAFQYMGFSAQFEMHQIKGEPKLDNDILFNNLTKAQTNGYFLSGGYVAQVNYFAKSIKTVISARYEELDINDLVKGNSRRFSPAIGYQLDGFDAMIKFQYFNIFKEESIDPFKWNEQFRIGFQMNFK